MAKPDAAPDRPVVLDVSPDLSDDAGAEPHLDTLDPSEAGGDADASDAGDARVCPPRAGEGDALADTGIPPAACEIPCLAELFKDCTPGGACGFNQAPLTVYYTCYENGVRVSHSTNHGSTIYDKPSTFAWKPNGELCYTIEQTSCETLIYRDGAGQVVATALLRGYDTVVGFRCGDQAVDFSTLAACGRPNPPPPDGGCKYFDSTYCRPVRN